MAITEEVLKLFKLLHGPDCNAESATLVIAELIKQVWIRSVLHHQRLLILDLTLRTLFTNRRPATIIPALKAQLRQKFFLIDILLPEVLAHVDFWARQSSN